MHSEKIKARIIKLLALATSSNEAESLSAMNKAVELMQKYSIDENQLHKQTIETLQIETKYKLIPSWVAVLYNEISKSAGVYCVYNNAIGFNNTNAEFYLSGRKSDILNVEYITTYLMAQIEKMSKEFTKTLPKDMKPMDKQQMSKSYRMGMSVGLGARMNEITKEFFKEINSTALVPVDDNIVKYNEAEEDFLKDNKVNMTKRTATLHQEAADRGNQDSAKISINKSIDGTVTPHEDALLLK